MHTVGNTVDTTCSALDQIGPDVFILLRARFVMDVARPRGSCFAPCKLLDLMRRTETTAVASKFTRMVAAATWMERDQSLR